MTPALDAWLWESLGLLATFQFTRAGLDILRAAPVSFVPTAQLADARGPRIVIPVDCPAPLWPDSPWSVPFGTTRLRLWNRVPQPGVEWDAVPSPSAPLWWRHPTGTLVPAWNLWANARDLLTYREDREIATRDAHGRYPADASPRHAPGLLDVPVLNDANAALLDAATALGAGAAPRLALPQGLVRPVDLALSHDCDQLRGNDAITQGVRAWRAVRALASGRAREAGRSLGALVTNTVAPRRYYAGNLAGMFDVERQFGFRSVAYFLTGRGGRFGARSGTTAATSIARTIPEGWEAGVHYNYHSVGDDRALRAEMAVVSAACGRPVQAGRAHYLRFDPVRDDAFLAANGIRYDESVGWPLHPSFRAGIGGPYRPFDAASGRAHDLVEVPLMCMDAPLAQAEGRTTFDGMFAHLGVVGGLLSVLVHPGAFFNPEDPAHEGVYHAVLSAAYTRGGRSWTPSEVLAAVDTWAHGRTRRPPPVAAV